MSYMHFTNLEIVIVLSEKYFVPVMCFVCFNIWDLFGRTMAGVVQFVSRKQLK